MKKKIILAFLCVILGVVAASCAQSTPQSKDKMKPSEEKSSQESATDKEAEEFDAAKMAEGYFVSKKEALKEYGLESSGMSVLATNWSDNLFLLDSGVNILALPDNHHIPEDILEKYQSFTDHDGKLDYAKILELKPQVIISTQKAVDEDEQLKKIVQENNIKIVQIPQRKTYDDVLKNIAIMSSVFGDEKIAKENIANYLQRVQDAKDLGKDSDKKNIAVINVTKDGQFVLGTDNFVDSILKKLDLKNVAMDMNLSGDADSTGFYPSPGMDEIAKAKPDSLVLLVRFKGDPAAKEAATKELIDSIKKSFGEDSDLVKNEKYEIIDHHGLIIASPMAISGLEKVASIAFE